MPRHGIVQSSSLSTCSQCQSQDQPSTMRSKTREESGNDIKDVAVVTKTTKAMYDLGLGWEGSVWEELEAGSAFYAGKQQTGKA